MNAEQFTHLDVRTSFTAGGVENAGNYSKAAYDFGMEAVGVTDFAQITAWPQFDRECQKSGIKPVFGIEIPFSSSALDQRQRTVKLLVRDEDGFTSVQKLLSLPRIERNDLMQNAGGLIAIADARCYELLVDIYDKSQLFMSVQRLGENESLRQLRDDIKTGEAFGAQIVASNNPWMATQQDYHQLLSIALFARANGADLPRKFVEEDMFARLRTNPTAYFLMRRMVTAEKLSVYFASFHPEQWLKTSPLMAEMFREAADNTSALPRTTEIARACSPEHLPPLSLPAYPAPEGKTTLGILQELCEDALSSRYPTMSRDVRERLSHELEVIGQAGLADYFLIAGDIVERMKSAGIQSEGVGSATGSIVCYLLGITHVDPVANGFLFERFLSTATRKLPDIDMMVEGDKRDQVVRRLFSEFPKRGIYPHLIATFPTYHIRSALRELMRVFDYKDDEISGVEHELFEKGTIAPELAPLKDAAVMVEQKRISTGQIGTHGSKVIFLSEPETPGYSSKDIHSLPRMNIDRHMAEASFNIDMLTGNPLTLINRTVNKIGPKFEIPRNDPETLLMIFRGDTVGVPYLETNWLIKVLSQYGVTTKLRNLSESDLVIAFGLSRPAVRESLTAYLRRRAKNIRIVSHHPAIQSVLGETLGTIIFQDQVLRLAREVAKFSPEESEELRRAISKDRKPGNMDTLRANFIRGAAANGVNRSTATRIFDYMRRFVSYGYIKGHAQVLMGEIAYKAAYLKRHYPQEYFETLFELLQKEHFSSRSLGELTGEAKRFGVVFR